jgi:hypothetical protein
MRLLLLDQTRFARVAISTLWGRLLGIASMAPGNTAESHGEARYAIAV